MNDRDEFFRAFLTEAKEALLRLDSDLVALESDPENAGLLDGVFRTLHTLKGSAGFLHFDDIRDLAHTGESLLSDVRSGSSPLTPEFANELLNVVDGIRKLVEKLDDKGESQTDYQPTMAVGRPKIPVAPKSVRISPSSARVPPPSIRVPPSAASIPPSSPPLSSPSIGPTPLPGDDPARPGASFSKIGFRVDGIRVDVELLDRLMNLVGELVLTRNQAVQSSAVKDDADFHKFAQRLNLITTELQEGIMKTRLQPISAIWQRLPRMVRDLARKCGKEVNLRIEGETTELDKSLLEALGDPMLHLIRNAIDHGIEKPAIRRARNKPEKGLLHLLAFHEGGQVHIEIRDDGGGLDMEKIRQKAIQNKVVTAEQSGIMTDREIQNTIFLPGFSTAHEVTDVSGRGVGMDVVKTKIEEIGGLVDLTSRMGEGTSVRLKVPLTLAIIPALIVECAGERYAIPQTSLLELISLSPETAGADIEQVFHSPVYRLRGKLLPLVQLRDLFRLNAQPRHGSVPIAVLQVDDQRFGLVVDQIVNVEEIVVKPMCAALKNVPVYSGGTILGDGRVALILDVLGLARYAGVLGQASRRAVFGDSLPPQMRIAQESALICEVGRDRRLGIPLAHVVRIELIPRNLFESSYGQNVVQYRDELIAIIPLGDHLEHEALDAPPDPVPVILCRDQNRVFGLTADRIIDFVEVPSDVRVSDREEILAGAAVILQRVTDILNVPGLIRKARTVFYETSTRSRLLQQPQGELRPER